MCISMELYFIADNFDPSFLSVVRCILPRLPTFMLLMQPIKHCEDDT
jgi:hypothetical protein